MIAFWSMLNLFASWEACMHVRKQQLELDMEQQTGSKEEKEYVKAVYCHPADLTSMQSVSWETLGWKKHKLESRLPGEISITSNMQMTPPLWQKVKRNGYVGELLSCSKGVKDPLEVPEVRCG